MARLVAEMAAIGAVCQSTSLGALLPYLTASAGCELGKQAPSEIAWQISPMTATSAIKRAARRQSVGTRGDAVWWLKVDAPKKYRDRNAP